MIDRDPIDGLGARALFASLGFGWVRRFLAALLAACVLLGAALVALGWVLEGEVTVRAVGTIQPGARHVVKAAVDGVVERVAVRGGDRVEAGDLLAVLAPRQERERLAQVEAELAVSAARQRALRAQLDQEQRVLAAVVAARQADVERAALTLAAVRREQGLASDHARPGWRRQPLEDLVPVRAATAAVSQARAELHVAQRQLRAGESRADEVDLERRQWSRLERERQELWQRLEGTAVRAPVGGVVLTRDLERRAGDRVQVGEALLELAAGDAWTARVQIRQVDRPRVEPGQRVRVFVEAYPHLQYGSIDGSLAGIAEQPAGGATAYPADIALRRTDLALADGMAAEAVIAIDRGPLLQLAWRRWLRELGQTRLPALRRART